jgi:HEPN domain-containing protein
VTRSLRDQDPELAAFCLQQAVEKLLKAYLLSKGWKLRRIHDLEALLDDAIAYDPSLDQFRNACQRITNYYVVERYPLAVETRFTADEVQTSLEAAGQLIEQLRKPIR